jgi:DNA-binding NarL/FixJ family response regulator
MLSKIANLAIVDDHALFRKALKNYLSEQKNINVIMQASDVNELLEKLRHFSIDVLVMDLFMPGLNGNDALRIIRSRYPEMKIIILSMNADVDVISDLLDSGIHGYISKSDEPDELLQAIQAVAEGRIYRNRIFTEALYWSKQHSISTTRTNVVLNEREKRILQIIWEEKTNKEIANELFLSVKSVEKIRQELKEKIGTRSTVGLLKYAISNQIIGYASIPGLIKCR